MSYSNNWSSVKSTQYVDQWSSNETFRRPERQAANTFDPETVETIRHLHSLFLNTTNLDELMTLSRKEQHSRIQRQVAQLILQEGINLPHTIEAEVINYILNEALGYGPLSKLILDPTVTEIMVNGPNQIFVERNGGIEEVTDVTFQDEKHLRSLVERIVARVGRRIDESNPRADARLDDGSRVNIVIPPISLDGSTLTIRKFQDTPLSLDDLVDKGMLTYEMAEFLKAAVRSKLSILVSGGTGTGKTTLLNALAEHIHETERIITAEDSAELKFHQQHPHVVRLETRPPNVQGVGQITIRDLVHNALRMRPTRVIVGEVRSAEARDMLQAMNTGHEGSMTTVHANTSQDALSRLEMLVRQSEDAANLPIETIRQQITSAIDLVIQITRYEYEGGSDRRVTAISEIQELRHGEIMLKDIFRFDPFSTDSATRRISGRFDATGVRPAQLPLMEVRGNKNLRPFFKSSLIDDTLGEYFHDDKVTEIMINGQKQVYIERRGEGMKQVPVDFESEAHLISVIKSILAPSGQIIDERNPMVDARLHDGSRVNATISPTSRFGPTITIRRFPKDPLRIEDLVRGQSLSQSMADFLIAAVQTKFNILISGGTGTGKTTMLNVLSSFIDYNERIVTIEDVAELRLDQDHWISFETQSADIHGEGQVDIRKLVINSLRMRPDRIIVGEVRGTEGMDMLEAMNTGHEGSMTTIHANSPQEAFLRLETMGIWSQMPLEVVQRKIMSAIDVIVQITRSKDGRRRVSSIVEVRKDTPQLAVREIFKHRDFESDPEILSQLHDEHFCVESQPDCLARMRLRGVTPPMLNSILA